MESTFHAPDIECDGCANSIKRALGRVGGVQSVDVDIAGKNVRVDHDPSVERSALVSALDRAGFPVAETS